MELSVEDIEIAKKLVVSFFDTIPVDKYNHWEISAKCAVECLKQINKRCDDIYLSQKYLLQIDFIEKHYEIQHNKN